MGFETRLRLDPILTPEGWVEMYAGLFAEMQDLNLRPSRITLGTYREKNRQLDNWREKWGLPPMEWTPPELSKEGTHRHLPEDRRIEVYNTIKSMLGRTMPDTPVSLCKETHAVRKETGLCGAECNCLS